MNCFQLVLVVVASAAFVAGQDKSGKIVGGTDVSILGYSYEVYITTDKGTCSGSIIGPTWVITTADCLNGATQISIRSGSANRLSGGTLSTGYVTFIHPQYAPGTYDYSYGLVMTWPPFPVDTIYYSTVKLPWYNPLPGSIVVVSGWGSTALGGSMVTNLKAVSMAVTTTPICQSYYSDVTITPRLMCAGGTGANTCVGDGGAPLVNQNTGELYGMAIFTKSCTTNGSPAGFVNVANQRYWIYSVTGI